MNPSERHIGFEGESLSKSLDFRCYKFNSHLVFVAHFNLESFSFFLYFLPFIDWKELEIFHKLKTVRIITFMPIC